VEAFGTLFLAGEGRPGQSLPADALPALRAEAWPGNLRELRNRIRRALVLAGEGPILAEHLGAGPEAPAPMPIPPAFSAQGTLTEEVRKAADLLEREWIRQALAQAAGNKAEAARILKVDYTTLHRKLKRHGLDETP